MVVFNCGRIVVVSKWLYTSCKSTMVLHISVWRLTRLVLTRRRPHSLSTVSHSIIITCTLAAWSVGGSGRGRDAWWSSCTVTSHFHRANNAAFFRWFVVSYQNYHKLFMLFKRVTHCWSVSVLMALCPSTERTWPLTDHKLPTVIWSILCWQIGLVFRCTTIQ